MSRSPARSSLRCAPSSSIKPSSAVFLLSQLPTPISLACSTFNLRQPCFSTYSHLLLSLSTYPNSLTRCPKSAISVTTKRNDTMDAFLLTPSFVDESFSAYNVSPRRASKPSVYTMDSPSYAAMYIAPAQSTRKLTTLRHSSAGGLSAPSSVDLSSGSKVEVQRLEVKKGAWLMKGDTKHHNVEGACWSSDFETETLDK